VCARAEKFCAHGRTGFCAGARKGVQKSYNQWKDWLNQKTFRRNVSEENIPSWVRSNQQWWYTHQTARKAYNLLAIQVKNGTHYLPFLILYY